MATRDELLPVLKATSRSFWLSIRLLPAETRWTVGVAYLLARAADSVADVDLVPVERRLGHLEALRDAFRAGERPAGEAIEAIRADVRGRADHPSEAELVDRLDEVVEAWRELPPRDRELVGGVLGPIVEGMVRDIRWFREGTADAPVALAERGELDRYCWHVAGVVGRFWTDLHAPRWGLEGPELERMRHIGVRFGKGLQLTNVLRDIPRDLRRGRCYLPAPDLAELDLEPAHLLDPGASGRVRPLVLDLLRTTEAHYRAGWAYVRSIPADEYLGRLATALPLLIGAGTLGRIARQPRILDPDVVCKIPRREVWGLLVGAACRLPSTRALDGYWRRVHRRGTTGWLDPGGEGE